MIGARNRVYAILCPFNASDARRTSRQMLLKEREFRLFRIHAGAESLQVFVGDMLLGHSSWSCSAPHASWPRMTFRRLLPTWLTAVRTFLLVRTAGRQCG
jgi:hypothetical protein